MIQSFGRQAIKAEESSEFPFIGLDETRPWEIAGHVTVEGAG